MGLQIIKDGYGMDAGVFVPVNDWNTIIQNKELVNIDSVPKKKLSELAGKLSHQTAIKMQQYVTESRNQWDDRLSKFLTNKKANVNLNKL